MKTRYSIGEMSKLFEIPITTLRHYHNKGIFTADYIDEETGYRYYSYEQFELLNNILNLRYGKVPLNKIKEYLEKENIHSLKEVFIEQKEALNQKIEELVKAKNNIEERLSYIERVEKIEIFGKVIEEIRGEREIFSIWKEFIEEDELELLVRELGKESNFSCRLIWGKVGLLMEKNKGYKKYSGIYLSGENLSKEKLKVKKQPAGKYLTIYFKGSREDSIKYYEMMDEYIEKKNIEVIGDYYEMALASDRLSSGSKDYIRMIEIKKK